MLCNKLLVCKVVDADKLHENTWVGANKKFQKVPWRSIARKKHNQPRTATQQHRRQEKLIKKEARKRETLREMGIDYDFDGCESHAQRCDVVPLASFTDYHRLLADAKEMPQQPQRTTFD